MHLRFGRRAPRHRQVQTRIVECSEQGEEACDAEWSGCSSHFKIKVNSIHLSEKRWDQASGRYEFSTVTMTKKATGQIVQFVLELNGQTFDLMTNSTPKKGWRSSNEMQIVIAKSDASLPAQALLSLRYKSPLGGEWCVDTQPVDLDLNIGVVHLRQVSSKSCAVM